MENKEDLISPEIARIHAHLCGDGSVYKYKTKEKDRDFRYCIGYYNKNQRLLDEFREDFNKVFNVKMKMRKEKDVSVSSLRIFKILSEKFGNFGSYNWRIPQIIMKSDNSIKIEWLKAFFNDESYYEVKYNRLKTKSMNYQGLNDVQNMLNLIGIKSNLTGPNCDNSYYLTISNFRNICEFNDFIKEPIRSYIRRL